MQLLIITTGLLLCLSLIQDSEQFPSRTNDKLRRRRSVIIKDEAYRWPNNEIHYATATNDPARLSGLEIIIAEYEEKTCLKFKKVPRNDPKYKVVLRHDLAGCYTFPGYLSDLKEKELNLGQNCDRLGTIRHELQHVMGVMHMQSAHDRDKYIAFHPENVEITDNIRQFEIFKKEKSNYFGGKYDFRSNMHYGSSAGAKKNKETMIGLKKSDHSLIDHRHNPHLSFYDLNTINKAYKCGDKCNAKGCTGYVDKNCKCITPNDPMFGGFVDDPKWPPQKTAGTVAKVDTQVIQRVMEGKDSVVRVQSHLPGQKYQPIGGKSYGACKNTAKVYYEAKSDQFLVHLQSTKASPGCYVGDKYLNPNTVYRDGSVTYFADDYARAWIVFYKPSFKPKVVLKE